MNLYLTFASSSKCRIVKYWDFEGFAKICKEHFDRTSYSDHFKIVIFQLVCGEGSKEKYSLIISKEARSVQCNLTLDWEVIENFSSEQEVVDHVAEIIRIEAVALLRKVPGIEAPPLVADLVGLLESFDILRSSPKISSDEQWHEYCLDIQNRLIEKLPVERRDFELYSLYAFMMSLRDESVDDLLKKEPLRVKDLDFLERKLREIGLRDLAEYVAKSEIYIRRGKKAEPIGFSAHSKSYLKLLDFVRNEATKGMGG